MGVPGTIQFNDVYSGQNVTCTIDYGDGTPPVSSGATACAVRFFWEEAHAYSEPGTYEVRFTFTDEEGASTERAALVTVMKRDTSIVVDAEALVNSTGDATVTARLVDRSNATIVLSGRTLEFEIDGQIYSAVTDTIGSATVTLPFASSAPNLVEVRWAGDAHYSAGAGAGGFLPTAFPGIARTGPPPAPDTLGRAFVLGFQSNFVVQGKNWLYLSGEEPAVARVEIPGFGFDEVVEIIPGSVARVEVPLEILQPLRVRDLHAAELGPPAVEGRLRDVVSSTHLSDVARLLGLVQDPDDLFFRKPLPLHLVSSRLSSRPTQRLDSLSRGRPFVIETKNLTGWIFGDERAREWTQAIYRKKYRFQNPLRQNCKHVKAVENLLGLRPRCVHSVVVFVGDSKFKTPMPPNVVYRRGLVPYIKSKVDVLLTESEVERAIHALESARISDREAKRRHRRSLRENRRNPICPRCGKPMVLRTARTGLNPGGRFWGCSGYPSCRVTKAFA